MPFSQSNLNQNKKLPKSIWATPLIFIGVYVLLVFFKSIFNKSYNINAGSIIIRIIAAAILGLIIGFILSRKWNYWLKGALLGLMYFVSQIILNILIYIGLLFNFVPNFETSYLTTFIFSLTRFFSYSLYVILIGTIIGGAISLYKNKKNIKASLLLVPCLLLLIPGILSLLFGLGILKTETDFLQPTKILPGSEPRCQGVSLIIKNIECAGKDVKITLLNSGTVPIESILLNFYDRESGTGFGQYARSLNELNELNESDENVNPLDLDILNLQPGAEVISLFEINSSDSEGVKAIPIIEFANEDDIGLCVSKEVLKEFSCPQN